MSQYPENPYGERLMKRFLSVLFPNEKVKDNFRPEWLKNPSTGQCLEIDRFYPSLLIGFEFQGAQHRLKNNPDQWKKDRIKQRLKKTQAKKVKKIILIYPGDLTFTGIYLKMNKLAASKKIQDAINKNISPDVISELDRLGKSYAQTVEHYYRS